MALLNRKGPPEANPYIGCHINIKKESESLRETDKRKIGYVELLQQDLQDKTHKYHAS